MEQTKEKITFNIIANPNAGGGKIERVLTQIKTALEQHEIQYTVSYAHTPELAREIAGELEAAGQKYVIAVGGDGTFSEVLNGFQNPSSVVLGLIPAGTGNDFLKTLGISSKPQEAIKHLLSLKTKQIDYIQGVNRRALNVVSTGIDIQIMRKYNAKKKRNKLNYYKALFSTIFRHKFCAYTIKTDAVEKEAREYFIVAVGNGKYFGSGMKVCPNSVVDDGKLNLVGIHAMKRVKILFRLTKFLKGKHLKTKYAEEHICQTAQLNNGEPMTVNYDGELIDDEPFDVRIIAGGLNILLDEDLTKAPR
jgi:YegS/Rv2252/BmrU family lipid kinase